MVAPTPYNLVKSYRGILVDAICVHQVLRHFLAFWELRFVHVVQTTSFNLNAISAARFASPPRFLLSSSSPPLVFPPPLLLSSSSPPLRLSSSPPLLLSSSSSLSSPPLLHVLTPDVKPQLPQNLSLQIASSSVLLLLFLLLLLLLDPLFLERFSGEALELNGGREAPPWGWGLGGARSAPPRRCAPAREQELNREHVATATLG